MSWSASGWAKQCRLGSPVLYAEMTAAHRRLHLLADRVGWSCAYCSVAVACLCFAETVPSGDGFAVVDIRPLAVADHVVPRCQGGRTTPDNLAMACGRCNSAKGGRTPEQWRGAA